jgi:phosphatidylinositol alpha-mannosyltransferase
LKVGILTQSYYPRYGGVTEHVHYSAIELQRRGHDVTIVTARFREGESKHAIPVERVGYNVMVPFNRSFVDVTVGRDLMGDLKRVFRRHDFDVLHTHCPTAPTLPLLGILAADCAQVGTFHTTHPRGLLQDVFQGYLRKVVDRLDEKIAVSHTALESALMYYPADYHIIPNGVDVERFHPAVPPFDEWRDPAHVNLLFVGRLDPRKGLQYLLRAMPEIVERTGRRARLLVIGNSALRPRFEAMVAPAIRDSVHFLGHVPSQDLARWYATGDIFVSPAWSHESFGIVLAEGMAAERTVVCSDIPGYRSVATDDVDAALFPPGDVRALARVVSELVDDPERRLRLARAGRQRSLEFAWPRVAARIEEVYHLALGHRGVAVSAPAAEEERLEAALR